MIRGLRDVTTLLNGRELFTTTGRYVNLADIPATMLQRVDVYKSQGADQVEGGVAGIIDVRTNRPFDFKEFTASVNTRAVYSDKSKATDPNISAMVANRWKTGIGEVGALLGLSQQQHAWELQGPHGAHAAVRHQPRLVTRSMGALRAAALAGVGVVQLPSMLVREQIARGELLHVIPGWAPRREIVHAVYPSRRGLLPAVRLLLDDLALRFAQLQED